MSGRSGCASSSPHVSDTSSRRSSAWRVPQIVGRPLVPASFALTLGVLAGPPPRPSGTAAALLAVLVLFPLAFVLAARRRILAALLLPLAFLCTGVLVSLLRLPPRSTSSGFGDRTSFIEGIVRESIDLGTGPRAWLIDLTGTSTAPGIALTRERGRVRLRGDRKTACGMPGDRVRFLAGLSEPKSEPGRPWDGRPRAAHRGVTIEGRLAHQGACTIVERAERSALTTGARTMRDRALRPSSPSDGPDPVRPLLLAFTTGDTSDVDPEILSTFERAGMPHLFAMTGLYVSVAILSLFLLARRILALVPRVAEGIGAHRLAAILILPFLLFTLSLQDDGPASVRIGVVLVLLFLPIALGRILDPWSALALAVMVTTVGDPTSLGDPRFQLAFAAISTPFRLYPAIAALLPKHGTDSRTWKLASKLAIGTAAVAIGTLPLVLRHFGGVSVSGLFGTLVALPIAAFVIMPLSLAGIALHGSSDALAAIPLGAAGIGASLVGAWARALSSFGAHGVTLVRPTIAECILFYLASTLLTAPARPRREGDKRRIGALRGLGLACLLLVVVSYAFHAAIGAP